MRIRTPLSLIAGLLAVTALCVGCADDDDPVYIGVDGGVNNPNNRENNTNNPTNNPINNPASQCAQPWECILATEGCCSPCSEPALADVTPMSQTDYQDRRAAECADPVACPACEPVSNPDLTAVCVAGICRASLASELPVTECASDDECMLRTTGCCTPCIDPGLDDVVAINSARAADYELLVCGTEYPGCPECAGLPIPDSFAAVCAAGRCVVETQ